MRGLACIAVVAGVMAGSGCSTTRATCTTLAHTTDPAQLAALYRAHQAPLILAGDSVLLCPCALRRQVGGNEEARRIGGNEEARRIGGNEEARQVGGNQEARRIGGSEEQRQVGGNQEARRIGGSEEQRRIGGSEEQRRISGASQVLTCVRAGRCGGFRYEGTGPIRVYDGTGVVDSSDGCVRD
ncbi:MAG TPA: hypothetical protein VN947_15035 [Polyangia bacterium]|nr:hypothetical protein [Polyangia bacterium]